MFYPQGALNFVIQPLNEISISPLDLGVQRGYSIFDFFKLVDLDNPWLEWYLDRFFHSLSKVNIEHNWTHELIRNQCQALFKANQIKDGYIKMIATRGTSDSGFFGNSTPTLLILALPIKKQKGDYYQKGARLLISEYLRDIPEVKTTNYIQSASLADQMIKEDAVDVLYYHQGLISEASRCNFFLVENNLIKTPSRGILAGITRKRILNEKDLPCPILEEDIFIKDLEKADEAFITSTTKGVMPITSVGPYKIGDEKVGKVTQELMQLVNQF